MTGTKMKLMTVKEAAELVDGLTEYRLRQMCLTGQVASIRAGRKILLTEEALIKAIYGEQSKEQEKNV